MPCCCHLVLPAIQPHPHPTPLAVDPSLQSHTNLQAGAWVPWSCPSALRVMEQHRLWMALIQGRVGTTGAAILSSATTLPSLPLSRSPGLPRREPSPSGCSSTAGNRPTWPLYLQEKLGIYPMLVPFCQAGSATAPPRRHTDGHTLYLHNHQPRSEVSSTCTRAPKGTESSSVQLPS